MKPFYPPAFACLAAFSLDAEDYNLLSCKKLQLHHPFRKDGANFGDLNNGGHNDLVVSFRRWEGPELKTRHTNNLNGDGYPDIVAGNNHEVFFQTQNRRAMTREE